MDASTILHRIKACFAVVPDSDVRANIGPRAFLVSLVFAFSRSDHTRTLDAIRQQVVKQTNTPLARSSFWQRLASKRLVTLLQQTVKQLLEQLTPISTGPLDKLAKKLGVKDILGHDSSSTSLPEDARGDFPGPRKNVLPAAFKWHNCMSIISGMIVWCSLSAATVHDRNGFPPLKVLVGRLILFDLGYWDFGLLRDLDKAGCLFLSRIKANAVIEIVKITAGLNKKKYEGRNLLHCRLPKKKKKIVDLVGTFGGAGHDPITLRIVGFWNKQLRCYHWYTTNLTVSAELIYPLYRLRWQLELAFKSAKSSFRLADVPSANKNIIKSLLLATVVASLVAFPLGHGMASKLEDKKQTAVSLQRSAKLVVNLAVELGNFILDLGRKAGEILAAKMKLLLPEIYDPNFGKRSSTARRAIDLAEATG